MTIKGKVSSVIEWVYVSDVVYDDPFNEVELDVLITSSNGRTWCIPTFWRGENRWVARFITKNVGKYTVVSDCSDKSNIALHGILNTLDVELSEEKSLSIISLSNDRTYLVDDEKNPFLWFSDTWWMALSSRLSYPQDFEKLVHKRKAQGFNIIMLVAGLFPDMDSFDKRAENEAGLPWKDEYSSINPLYFDEADKRITSLVDKGLTPCILGSWGYYLLHMGKDKMKQHWRYIIARWGAYPVIWCIAGEANMPYYLSKQKSIDKKILQKGWTDLAEYIKSIEAFNRLITIHPTEIGREQIRNANLLDINLIQSSHNDYSTVSNTAKFLLAEKDKVPIMPLIMGESNYEGILNNKDSKIQRLTFWTAILSGSKGYSYGANGIWQINTLFKPFGNSPHGISWGDTPWEESYQYQGAVQLGYAKRFLENYEWWLLEPQPECILPYQDLYRHDAVRTAGIDSRLRITYFHESSQQPISKEYYLIHLYINMEYEAYFWDPSTGERIIIGKIKSDYKGRWRIPNRPTVKDWILVLSSIETLTYIPKKKYSLQNQRLLNFIKQLFIYRRS